MLASILQYYEVQPRNNLRQNKLKLITNKIGENILLATRKNQVWFPSLFNDFFNVELETTIINPAMNVIAKEDAYVVELAAPGVGKEDFKVSLDTEDRLVISLEKEEVEEAGVRYLKRGFAYKKYSKAFALPEDVDRNKISAKVENGVLTVELPKKNEEEMKKEIKWIEIR